MWISVLTIYILYFQIFQYWPYLSFFLLVNLEENSLIHRPNFFLFDMLIWYTPIEPFSQTPSIVYRFFLALFWGETKADYEKPEA